MSQAPLPSTAHLMGSVLPETTRERVVPSLLSVAATCGGRLKFAVVGTVPKRPLGLQVISGYVPAARPEPSTTIVGVPVKVTVPVTLSGAMAPGVTEPKLN